MTLKILVTTDVHGHLNQGLGQITSLREEFQADLLIDNGDFLVGNAFATYGRLMHDISPLVQIANQLDYDVMVPGNHDMDYGLDWLKKQVSEINADYVCANLVDHQKNLIFKPYTILEKQGQKVAVIGLMTYALSQLMPEKYIGQVKVISPFKALEEVLTRIEVDLIIVAYHGGLTNDPSSGKIWHYPSLEDQAYQIMDQFPEINSVLCGHQHFVNEGVHQSHGTALLQPGAFGKYLGFQEFKRDKLINNRIIELEEVVYPHEWLEDYRSCLQESINLSSLSEYVKQNYPDYDLYFLDFKAETVSELAQEISGPFPLGEYRMTGLEIMQFSQDNSLNLDTSKIYSVLASENIFPLNRLKEFILINLFDDYMVNRQDS